MSIGAIYSLNDAQRMTGANRALITFLIKDRQIPFALVGMAKVLDDDGMARLRQAIAEYDAKTPASATA